MVQLANYKYKNIISRVPWDFCCLCHSAKLSNSLPLQLQHLENRKLKTWNWKVSLDNFVNKEGGLVNYLRGCMSTFGSSISLEIAISTWPTNWKLIKTTLQDKRTKNGIRLHKCWCVCVQTVWQVRPRCCPVLRGGDHLRPGVPPHPLHHLQGPQAREPPHWQGNIRAGNKGPQTFSCSSIYHCVYVAGGPPEDHRFWFRQEDHWPHLDPVRHPGVPRPRDHTVKSEQISIIA